MLGKKKKDQDIFMLQNSCFGIWCFDNSARDSKVTDTAIKLEKEMSARFLTCVSQALQSL